MEDKKPQIKSVSLEWKDGKYIYLSKADFIVIKDYTKNIPTLIECLRFLAELGKPRKADQ